MGKKSLQNITKRKQAEETLKRAEEKYRTLFTSISDAAYLIDQETGRILEVNKAAEEMYGYTRKEWLNMKNTDVSAEPDKTKKATEELPPTIPIRYHKKKDGTVFPIEMTVGSFMLNGRRLIIATGRDITKRKKTEKELRDAKAFSESIISSAIDGVVVTNFEGNFIKYNDAFLKMMGYFDDELKNKNFNQFTPKKWSATDKKELKKLTERMPVVNYEKEFIKKNGSVFPVTINASILSGEEYRLTAIIRDETERKKADEKLAKYHNQLEELVKERTIELGKTYEKLDSIINSASEIIIAFDRNKKVTTWNKTAELITGYKLKEIIGKPLTKLDVFDDSKAVKDAIGTVYGKKLPIHDKIVLRTKKGDKRIISLSGSTIKDDSKRLNGCLFIGKDITSDIESHGKLLKGNSYLIPDKTNKSAVDLFTSLTNSDYKGLFITRGEPTSIKSMISTANAEIALLKQNKTKDFENIPDFRSLIDKIRIFSKTNINSVILLDRVDYLLTNFSFEQLVKSIYQITDIISESNSILLLHLNPSIVDTRQLAIIEDELQLLPSQKIEDIEISDELYDILKFIYEQNQKNAIASVKKIGKEFSIVDKTTTKRLRNLEDKGLIYIKKQGRTKTLHASEKGKTLLHIRQVI